MNNDNWKNIILKREQAKSLLYSEIQKLEKKAKKIGTTDALQYIADEIERIYGYPCRVRKCGVSHRNLVLYKNTATKKQIRYDRPEVTIGSLLTKGYFVDDLVCDFDKYNPMPLPSTISEIYELLIKKNGWKDYIARR